MPAPRRLTVTLQRQSCVYIARCNETGAIAYAASPEEAFEKLKGSELASPDQPVEWSLASAASR